MNELLWLLLPVAAVSGWYVARREHRRQILASRSPLSPDYFKGINYLLNEQPDKAIEVFVRMLKVDSETVEIHLALGKLFRRRGEVDRAIRIHQNLIARPTLNKEQRSEALLELGQDYMRAGLLDRAEGLFLELVEMDAHVESALRLLSDIYQQEKEWDNAIEITRKLEKESGKRYKDVIAQFYCELAEEAVKQGNADKAGRMLSRALGSDKQCVRASMLQGEMAMAAGDFKEAIRAYKRVEDQDAEYVSEIIRPLTQCYRQLGRHSEFAAYLRHLLDRHAGVTVMIALAEIIREDEGQQASERFLVSQLRAHPTLRGIARLAGMNMDKAEGATRDLLAMLKDNAERALEGKPIYKCVNCGFAGRTLHWRCPGCKNWNSIKPIHGLEGE
jgi:lipopolysaccharide biosynthesis regulator YciM